MFILIACEISLGDGKTISFDLNNENSLGVSITDEEGEALLEPEAGKASQQ